MQTSLPDLPFTNYGNAELDPSATYSASKETLWNPRTNLRPSRLGPPFAMTLTKLSNLQPPVLSCLLLHSLSMPRQRQGL